MRASARIGHLLRDKWRLDCLLGAGGMAAVYAASHRNGTRAAVKMLHPELSPHAHVRARFLKEGYVANKVGHPGVVRVIDDDVAEDGALFLVMELLDGESLEERRERLGGRLEMDEVLAAADQLLDVLATAHSKGIVHRDIKPENVFLTRDGLVKVLDFGIARLRELSSASSATRTGSTMGTPAFMPPEQARGLWDEVDGQSDLWSVGATMFTLLTGQVVHQGRTSNELLLAAMTQPAPLLRTVVATAPEYVAAIVDRALAQPKSERWPDAGTMQEAVRRAYHRLHGAPISTHPPMTVPQTVPNRTLPSTDIQAAVGVGSVGTGPAVATGKTGVPLRSSVMGMPRTVFVAGGIIGGLGALVLATVLVVGIVRVRGLEKRSSSAAEGSGSVFGMAGPGVTSAVSDADAGDASVAARTELVPPAGTPVVALEDLPKDQPASSKRPTAGEKKTQPGGKPPSTRQPGTDWKEQRK